MDVVQERDGSNVVRANLTRVGNIGGLLARQTYTSAGALDKTAFYSYDGSGNVVGTTDASQNVQSAYLYDAFGQSQLAQENAGYSQPYRYSTKWQHAQSGLYDYGYRFYNAGLGRWINRDPIGEEGGVHLYAFVGNDAVNSWDEYGEQPSPQALAPVGGGILAAAAAFLAGVTIPAWAPPVAAAVAVGAAGAAGYNYLNRPRITPATDSSPNEPHINQKAKAAAEAAAKVAKEALDAAKSLPNKTKEIKKNIEKLQNEYNRARQKAEEKGGTHGRRAKC